MSDTQEFWTPERTHVLEELDVQVSPEALLVEIDQVLSWLPRRSGAIARELRRLGIVGDITISGNPLALYIERFTSGCDILCGGAVGIAHTVNGVQVTVQYPEGVFKFINNFAKGKYKRLRKSV